MAAALALGVLACTPGDGGLAAPTPGRDPAPRTGAAAQAVETDQNYPPSRIDALRRQAQRLLDRRVRAVRAGDRRAFLADVDPSNARLRARQRTYFHNLTALPLRRLRWTVLEDTWPSRYFAPRPYRDTAYLPFVDAVLQLRGFDARPVHDQIGLTFAPGDDGRLMLVGDRDVADQLEEGAQERPWDLLRLVVRREGRLLVLLDERSAARAGEIVAALRTAADTVGDVVPGRWDGRVVAYATGSRRVISAVDDVPGGSLRRIGALAFGVPSRPGSAPADFRFLLNPAVLDTGEPGLTRLVTHEMTHVALGSRDDAVPVWLTEGIAEWVSVQDLPPEQTFMPRAVVERAGGEGAQHLPTSAGFNGAGQTWNYGLAWFACEYITDTFGDDRLFLLLSRLARVEEAALARGDVAGGPRVEQVVRRTVGISSNELARRATEKIVSTFGGWLCARLQGRTTSSGEPVEHPRVDLGLVARWPKRPEGPACAPAPSSTRNWQRGDHAGSLCRSAATHLAGSDTITRGSCSAPVTSRSGRPPAGGRLSYGE